jgi:hypothetical protein
MKNELEEKLVKKYPDALSEYGSDPRHSCMAWGFACGDGWYKIIEELCEKVGNIPGFKFAQVKEKFGALTIYYDGPNTEDDRAIVRKAINEAENKSVVICETCGEKGERASQGGWLSTECKKCKILHDINSQNR